MTVEDARSGEATALLAQQQAELGALYGYDGVGSFRIESVAPPGGFFVVARLDGGPVGCGAVRRFTDGENADPGVGEVKRMYVDPSRRGQGVGRAILAFLEEEAGSRRGFHTLVLETGTLQPDAVRLYTAAGYRPIPRYGEFADDPRSLCYEKRLAVVGARSAR